MGAVGEVTAQVTTGGVRARIGVVIRARIGVVIRARIGVIIRARIGLHPSSVDARRHQMAGKPRNVQELRAVPCIVVIVIHVHSDI